MSVAREMAAAGPGCAVANGLLNGFETVKVKLQLQNPAQPAYRSAITTGVMTQIIQEEGIIKGLLTPGLSASLTRSMLYGAYRIGLYSTTRDWLSSISTNNTNSNDSHTPHLMHRVTSGMLTGGLGAMLTCPLDVVRTRMQADAGNICTQNRFYTTGLRKGKVVRYRTLYGTIVQIWRQDGLSKGLYRGASVTIARASLLNGAQLASYETLKQTFHHYIEEGPALHILCAFCSGIIAQTFAMPIDTIKSSMMVGNRIQDVGGILKHRGPYWLYKGYLPACAGQGLIMVLQMPLVEEFRRLLGLSAI